MRLAALKGLVVQVKVKNGSVLQSKQINKPNAGVEASEKVEFPLIHPGEDRLKTQIWAGCQEPWDSKALVTITPCGSWSLPPITTTLLGFHRMDTPNDTLYAFERRP